MVGRSPRSFVEDIHRQYEPIAAEKYSFGPVTGTVLFCCQNTRVAVDGLFYHLRTSSKAHFHLSLMCRTCRPRFDTEVSWDWTTMGRDREVGVAWVAPEWDSLIATDSQRSTMALVSRGLSSEDFSRREVMRLLLHHVLDYHKTIGIHGATVGRDTSGILLTNRGGSGKSTLVLEALRRGYSTTGDDFLLINASPAGQSPSPAYSLFSNAKIDPASSAARDLTVSTRLGEIKGLVDIKRHFPDSLRPSHRLTALVVPQVGPMTSLVPTTSERFITAILPSSIRLTGKTMALIQAIEDLAKKIPSYELTVGPRPEEGIDALEELILR